MIFFSRLFTTCTIEGKVWRKKMPDKVGEWLSCLQHVLWPQLLHKDGFFWKLGLISCHRTFSHIVLSLLSILIQDLRTTSNIPTYKSKCSFLFKMPIQYHWSYGIYFHWGSRGVKRTERKLLFQDNILFIFLPHFPKWYTNIMKFGTILCKIESTWNLSPLYIWSILIFSFFIERGLWLHWIQWNKLNSIGCGYCYQKMAN